MDKEATPFRASEWYERPALPKLLSPSKTSDKRRSVGFIAMKEDPARKCVAISDRGASLC